MLIVFPKETGPKETRIAIIPSIISKYTKLGVQVILEKGLGEKLHISDQDFIDAGAKILEKRQELLASADIIITVKKPNIEEVPNFKTNSLYISFLDPFSDPNLIDSFNKHKISSISMEMIPRITRAQKMDALSSQANLAGYAAVILAASRSYKAFPMMVTAAGTISPAKVFIIGVGVAGLQAIATAKRLGARVEAFDTRPETEEQVHSLGAKFVSIDLGEIEKTKDGYAKALTEQQIAKQREEMTKVCARSDVIITTAQVFGKKAPILITQDMIKQMQPGTIVVDMAVGSGGNVEGSKADQEVIVNQVKIIGHDNLPGTVALHASQMYANNIYHLIEHFWDKTTNAFNLDYNDEILKGCLLTNHLLRN